MLLISDGRAAACGFNLHGQCNIPPLRLGLTYVHVAAGYGHTVLLRSDGAAVACGNNDDGQCDMPDLDEDYTIVQASEGWGHGPPAK